MGKGKLLRGQTALPTSPAARWGREAGRLALESPRRRPLAVLRATHNAAAAEIAAGALASVTARHVAPRPLRPPSFPPSAAV
jgi:hypothetical protein